MNDEHELDLFAQPENLQTTTASVQDATSAIQEITPTDHQRVEDLIEQTYKNAHGVAVMATTLTYASLTSGAVVFLRMVAIPVSVCTIVYTVALVTALHGALSAISIASTDKGWSIEANPDVYKAIGRFMTIGSIGFLAIAPHWVAESRAKEGTEKYYEEQQQFNHPISAPTRDFLPWLGAVGIAVLLFLLVRVFGGKK